MKTPVQPFLLHAPVSIACDGYLWYSRSKKNQSTTHSSAPLSYLLTFSLYATGQCYIPLPTKLRARSQMLSWVTLFDGNVNRPIKHNIMYFSSSRQPNLTQICPYLGGGRNRCQMTGGITDPVPNVTFNHCAKPDLVCGLHCGGCQ